MLGAGARAGHVAARAAHQLRRLPPATRLRLAARQAAEVGLGYKSKFNITIPSVGALKTSILNKIRRPIA